MKLLKKLFKLTLWAAGAAVVAAGVSLLRGVKSAKSTSSPLSIDHWPDVPKKTDN